MSAPIDVIVVGLHLQWDGVWQRPNHVLSRLAQRADVVVVEEPRAGHADVDLVSDRGSVTVVQPQRIRPGDVADAATCEVVRALVGERRALVWLYTPLMLPLAEAFPGVPLVYDKMDDLAGFKNADPRIVEREPEVLRRAVVAFAGGASLAASIAERTARARCYPSGVDVQHFRHDGPPDDAVSVYARPRIGYVGVIDERLDLDLIDALAVDHPAWSLLMIGPTVKIDPATRPRRENIAYLGKRAYDDLPAILAGLDVGMMPFARNEATRSISPTKTLEYLAAGLPVVSTSVPDVVAGYTGIVAIADEPAAFGAAVADALRQGRTIPAVADERLAAGSWDGIVAGMAGDLRNAGVRLAEAAERTSAKRSIPSWRSSSSSLAASSVRWERG